MEKKILALTKRPLKNHFGIDLLNDCHVFSCFNPVHLRELTPYPPKT